MTRYWFKPKRYGYGATPVTWEGWAVTFAFAAFIIGMSVWRLRSGAPASEEWFYWFAAVIVATVALVGVSYWKTDGTWRWQWGGGSNSNSGRE